MNPFQLENEQIKNVMTKLPNNCNIENKMAVVEYRSKYDTDMQYSKYPNVLLPLPTEELGRYLMEQGIKNKEDCQVESISCELNGLENAVNSLLYPDNSSPVNMDISELNYLFHLVSKMSDEEQSVFCNTLTLHPPGSIKDLINQTANLDKVCIASNIYTTKQLGEFLIENDFYDFDIEIIPLLDASKLAEQHMAGNKGMIDTKNGLYIEDTAMPEERVVIYDGKHIPIITENSIDEENNMEPELDTGPLQQW